MESTSLDLSDSGEIEWTKEEFLLILLAWVKEGAFYDLGLRDVNGRFQDNPSDWIPLVSYNRPEWEKALATLTFQGLTENTGLTTYEGWPVYRLTEKGNQAYYGNFRPQ